MIWAMPSLWPTDSGASNRRICLTSQHGGPTFNENHLPLFVKGFHVICHLIISSIIQRTAVIRQEQFKLAGHESNMGA